MIGNNEIERLAKIELAQANEKYPLFHSQHEAYGVLREEIEEAVDEINKLLKHEEQFWVDVKNDINTDYIVRIMKGDAIEAVKELIQVIAMCDKVLMPAEDPMVKLP